MFDLWYMFMSVPLMDSIDGISLGGNTHLQFDWGLSQALWR